MGDAEEREQLVARVASLQAELALLREEPTEHGNVGLLAGIKDQLFTQNGVLQDVTRSHAELQSNTEARATRIGQETVVVKSEVDGFKEKYEDLLAIIGRLEERMVVIVGKRREAGEKHAVVTEQLGETNGTLQEVLGRTEQYKSEYQKLLGVVRGSEVAVAKKNAEISLARAKLEYASDSVLQAKQQSILETTAEMESELGARQRLIEAQKDFVKLSKQEEEKLASEIDLFKARLESVRKEFKEYKDRTQADLGDLKGLLVQSQQELGELKGSTSLREKMVMAAQEKLKAAPPWIGADILSGQRQRVRVVNVRENGPAEKGGLKKNDLIEQANGEYTRVTGQFKEMLTKVRAGDTISLQVQRERKMLNFHVLVSSKDMAFEDITILRRIAGGIVCAKDEEFMARVGGGDSLRGGASTATSAVASAATSTATPDKKNTPSKGSTAY